MSSTSPIELPNQPLPSAACTFIGFTIPNNDTIIKNNNNICFIDNLSLIGFYLVLKCLKINN